MIKSVDFLEFSIVATENSNNSDFDIIGIETNDNQEYCLALLNKFSEIPYTKIKELIVYQMNLTKNKLHWLKQADKLLLANKKLFKGGQNRAKFNKIRLCINNEKLKKISKNKRVNSKSINAKSNDRFFCFTTTKKYITKLDSDCQKILHLTNEKYEYLQANLILVNPTLETYDILCQKKIDQIEHLQSLNEKLGNNLKHNIEVRPISKKLTFNGNVNQLVDIFYQLSRELFVDGKPFLDGNLNEIANTIINSFCDKEGNDLSLVTVRTILTPSREEKRPNAEKRIDLDKLI